jgi:hypothetical protein
MLLHSRTIALEVGMHPDSLLAALRFGHSVASTWLGYPRETLDSVVA